MCRAGSVGQLVFLGQQLRICPLRVEKILCGCPIKDNRLTAPKDEAITVWLNPDSYREDFPVLLTRQVLRACLHFGFR